MPQHFSFSGCGFLGIYHFGVSTCLQQHVPKLMEDCKIAGASAGSFVACCLITGCSIDDCARYFVDLVHHAESQPILGPLHPRFKLISELRESIVKVLPADAYKKASGRLFISLTQYSDLKNVIVSEYESNKELIEAMLCSSFIPFYCGIIPPTFKGNAYWDGGMSDNQPVFEEPTITVSPFSGEVDICPQDNSANFIHLNINNSSVQFTEENLHRVSIALFPPNSITMSEIFKQGYDDTLQYLQKNGMINCIDHPLDQEVPNFQSEYSEDEEPVKTERTRSRTESVTDYECRECKQKLRKSLFACLPPHLLQVFQSTFKEESILKHISQGKVLRAMTNLASSFLAPADIMWAYITDLIRRIPRRKHEFEHIMKHMYLLIICLAQNYLHQPCKHNKQLTKTNECIEAVNSNYFSNILYRAMQKQVYKSIGIALVDDKDPNPNLNAINPNTDILVENLGYDQETLDQTYSEVFDLSSSCFTDTQDDNQSQNNSSTDRFHSPILSHSVRNRDDFQNENNTQLGKSDNMEADNQQNIQMDLPDLVQNSTLMNKPFLKRSDIDSLSESKSRSTSDNVVQNESEYMEADKNQNLSEYKECTISAGQSQSEKLLNDPLSFNQNDGKIQSSGDNQQKHQIKTMETKNICIVEELGSTANKPVMETSIFEPPVDCDFDSEHEHISDISQETRIVKAHLDGPNSEIFSNCKESHINMNQTSEGKSFDNHLGSSNDIEEINYTISNIVQTNAQEEINSLPELSKYDESNEQISSNNTNVHTLYIQHFAADMVKIQNGGEPENNQEVFKDINMFSRVMGFFSL